MKKRKSSLRKSIGKIIAAIFWILIIVGLVLLNINYDPNKHFSGSFFDDVSETMRWSK